jgi:hypothetical protein
MFKSPNDFSLFIEKEKVKTGKDYMDCILDYCQENYIDPEDVAALVNKNLRQKIAFELTQSNYFPKKASLDL